MKLYLAAVLAGFALLSPPLAPRLESCTIDRAPREQEKPSDHTPITVTLR